jgi:radical SAM protein with 4Fe4S-binding SPASM domain
MINLSKLLMAGAASFPGDELRFGAAAAKKTPPVIVWHITGSCNLSCRHCYSAVAAGKFTEMDECEAESFIDSLAALDPPALLMSGGEPLTHPGFFSYLSRARLNGTKVSISTHGTLIDDGAARAIAALGVSYVGVSADGVGALNDDFRGKKGAFSAALRGMESLASHGFRVGLRVTLAGPVRRYIDSILELALRLPLSRICFYHFFHAGRGVFDEELAPDPDEERRAVNLIIRWAEDVCTSRRDDSPEILTVGDASDGVLVYKYLLGHDPARASRARELLARYTSRRIGPGILSVRWDGAVFPNQFSWGEQLGSWRDIKEIVELRTNSNLLHENNCKSCEWSDICAGRLRGACMLCGDRIG